MCVHYVDDTVVVANTISARNKMIYSDETYMNDTMTDEVRTTMTQSQIADTLDPNIQFTCDSLEQNSDRRLPVLDLKLRVERDKNGYQFVQFSLFKKEVASKYTILK